MIKWFYVIYFDAIECFFISLHSKTMEKELIKRKIKEAVVSVDPTAKVVLFGSRARGTETKESDWDILVLLDRPKVTFKDEKAFRDKLFDVELEVEEPFSTFYYSILDWNTRHSVTPLYKNIQEEGIYL